jgi:sulfur-carrier protein adenylyltransferase/sulfurtransferase
MAMIIVTIRARRPAMIVRCSPPPNEFRFAKQTRIAKQAPLRQVDRAMQPDYSRQISLKEIGADGQAKLARARVLIVGVGGLGSPVLQYLAGAGVGHLGLMDADTLDASNLHRQPIYALADTGSAKVALARSAVQAINPDVTVDAYAERFTADNALDRVRAHDIVVDCSDNFRTKFLINDAAVLAQRPAVFASVYQYEGQMQVYQPTSSHACLRCLWPEATADGVVGNCAEAGVLGPVPGTLGSLQALLTLKILLGIPGQLGGELLLLDFMNFSSTLLKATRRAACSAPACALIHDMPREERDLEIELPSLAAAADRHLEVIDIRTAEEVAAQPATARHIDMPALLAHPELLSANGEYLLVCASGKRSLATARELRKRGLAVRSLAGGLQALRT